MADNAPSATSNGASSAAGSSTPNAAPKPPPPPKRNPAFRMLGIPNFRWKLPSRNWLIFLSITGSFTGALLYDRRQKKLAQKNWCTLVSHIANEPLPVNQVRRKLTIFLAAPPGDGLRNSREYFQQYVKPVLVAAALDYEVIEGRREGDVRAGLAEKIRALRRKRGEGGTVALEDTAEELMTQVREKGGILEEPGVKGDLVVGRHAWKEYIRGLHEGWLGPLDPPGSQPDSSSSTSEPSSSPSDPFENSAPSTDDILSTSSDDASPTSPSDTDASPAAAPDPEPAKPSEPEKPPPPSRPTPAYIQPSPSAYASARLPPSLPPHLEPSDPIPHPHILGFLNTPIRIYRFLNQRHLADRVGREVAAIVLAASRPYTTDQQFASSADLDGNSSRVESVGVAESGRKYEQQTCLVEEEKEWHKSVRKRADGEGERVWLDDVVLDARIAERMGRFELGAEEEHRARRIGEGREGPGGGPVEREVGVWQGLLRKVGLSEEEDPRKVVLGNIEEGA